MMYRARFLFPAAAAMILIVAGAPAVANEVGVDLVKGPKYTLSTSRQFIVYGDDNRERIAFATSAEAVKKELAALLRFKDEWEREIVIEISESDSAAAVPGGSRSAGVVIPLENGFRFQLNVLGGLHIDREEFNHELLRLLLLETMLRSYEDVEEVARSPKLLPAWLHHGIGELMRYRRDGTPSELFAGLLKSRKILAIEDIFSGDPGRMDSVSRAVYIGSTAAFVKALLEQDSGRQRLAKTLRELPRYQGDLRPLLLELFPALASSSKSIEKWWALEVASMAQPKALDFLSIEETQRRLDEALTVRLFGDETTPSAAHLSDYKTIERSEDYARALTPTRAMLTRLSQESFPLYRSVVEDYRALVERILLGKTLGISKRFRKVAERREEIDRLLADMIDYMNWFEAAQMPGRSGAFQNYRSAVEELRREEPLREDVISLYLDEMEAGRWRERPAAGGTPETPGG